MRTLVAGLITELEKSPLTLARLFEVTPLGSSTLYYTDHDQSIVHSGHTYLSTNTISIQAVESTTGDVSTNTEVTITYGDAVTREQFLAGLLDNATFKVYLISWSNPSAGVTTILNGILARKSVNDRQAGSWSVKGLLRLTDGFLGEVSTAKCRNQLGDSRCQVDLATFSETFTVDSVLDPYAQFDVTMSDARTEAFFDFGFIKFVTDDYPVEVLSYHILAGLSARVTLALPRMFATVVGDEGQLTAGCDKSLISACLLKFDNVLNFRGEPFNPTDSSATGSS